MKNNRTFLEKLLDGTEVEWKPLDEVANIVNNARKPVKSSSRVSGNIPYYGANNIQDYVEGYTHEGEFVLIAEDGSASLENYSIQWAVGKFWANNHVHVVNGKEKLNNRFLYHYLTNMNFIPFLAGKERAKLTKAKLQQIPIPIPPLSVQTEIVKILDALTVLTSELTSELILRQKQYEYYREKLLSFDSLELSGVVVQWIKLIDLGELIRGNGLQKKDFTETGVPAIHYGQIYTYYGTFATKTKSFVSPELAKKLKKVDCGDVVITNTSENFEDVGKAMVYLGKEQAVTGGHATIFKPNHEKILSKYFVYLTQTSFFTNEKRKYAKGTKVIDVSATDMAKIILPIPPLEEQHRIVSILDKFETLTNSITEGLPLAIEQSQKRYEYYRELLLNFKQ